PRAHGSQPAACICRLFPRQRGRTVDRPLDPRVDTRARCDFHADLVRETRRPAVVPRLWASADSPRRRITTNPGPHLTVSRTILNAPTRDEHQRTPAEAGARYPLRARPKTRFKQERSRG